MTPPTKKSNKNKMLISVGWPLTHIRCNTCGRIGVEGYSGIQEDYCSTCARPVQTTTYVSIAVSNSVERDFITEVLTNIRMNKDRNAYLLPFQKAVIDAAKRLFTPTNAGNPLEASEIDKKRREALHGAIRHLEYAEKAIND